MSKKAKKKLNKILISLFLFILTAIYFTFLEEPINNLLNNKKGQAEPVSLERKELSKNTIDIHYIDVGQADCILITNKKQNILIDAGNNNDGQKLVKYFESLGINEFEYVFATHPHEDHIGGMDDIIRSFKIKKFYMPDVVTTSKTFEDMLDALEEKNIEVEIPKVDTKFSSLNAEFNILYVGNDENNLNDSSIVFKMTYQNKSFLFTGDASSNVESKILNKDISADVLKVGHHGSKYSSSVSFLKKVNPKYAIIQVGKNNIYNHPTEETLNKLKKNNIKVLRTDIDGTIILSTNGTNIEFRKVETDTNG